MLSNLLSVRLWRRFWGVPPHHPLMVLRFHHPAPPRRYPEWLVGGIVSITFSIGLMIALTTPIILGWLMLGVLLFIVSGGTVRGLLYAFRVAQRVRQERRDPALEAMLNLTPVGGLGVTWMLALRTVRGGDRNHVILTLLRGAQICAVLLLMGVIGLLLVGEVIIRWYGQGSLDTSLNPDVWGWALVIGLCIGWMVLDDAQAPLLGVMCGLWGASVRRHPHEAWMWSVMAYLGLGGLGLAVWGVLLGGIGALLEASYGDWFFSGSYGGGAIAFWGPLVLFILGALATAALVRETLLRVMWHRLCRHWNADERGLDLL
ncbi:MAG: hypothetical protein MUC99_00530 [Anaerolineae bacterium]|nr:hypothetical protein [Anaerolineae bacterium]